jgi:light-regulated signal transduction histidine kinase (bacteriophytochrome)
MDNQHGTDRLPDWEQRVAEHTPPLDVADQELATLSYALARELRTTVRAIQGFAGILLDDYTPHLDAQGQRYLHRMQENALHMHHLVNDLLTFARVSHKPLHRERVAPADMVRQVWHGLHQERAHRRVDVTIADLPTCQADLAQLRQVFLNLVENALKFTRGRPGACIEVGCQARAGAHVYFVRDNGVGFDMHEAPKLFGVFQRLHHAAEYEGTGVGLATVQRIIHRHGGRVWAEGAVDQGATFFFTLSDSVSKT